MRIDADAPHPKGPPSGTRKDGKRLLDEEQLGHLVDIMRRLHQSVCTKWLETRDVLLRTDLAYLSQHDRPADQFFSDVSQINQRPERVKRMISVLDYIAETLREQPPRCEPCIRWLEETRDALVAQYVDSRQVPDYQSQSFSVFSREIVDCLEREPRIWLLASTGLGLSRLLGANWQKLVDSGRLERLVLTHPSSLAYLAHSHLLKNDLVLTPSYSLADYLSHLMRLREALGDRVRLTSELTVGMLLISWNDADEPIAFVEQKSLARRLFDSQVFRSTVWDSFDRRDPDEISRLPFDIKSLSHYFDQIWHGAEPITTVTPKCPPPRAKRRGSEVPV